MKELERLSGPKASIPVLVARAVDQVYLPENIEAALETVHANQARLEARSRKAEVRHQIPLETLFFFVRLYVQHTPELPPADLPAAHALANKWISRLMDRVAQTVGTKASIIGLSNELTELLYDTPLPADDPAGDVVDGPEAEEGAS